MPVSQRPRRAYNPHEEQAGPNPYTPAGTLLYGFYELGALRRLGGPTMEEMGRRARTQKPRTRRGKGAIGRSPTGRVTMGDKSVAPCDPAGSRAAERRKRQGAHLHQHPSVVARFANHPTRAEIDEQISTVEKLKRAGRRLIGAAA